MRKKKPRGRPFRKGNIGGPGRPPKLKYTSNPLEDPTQWLYLQWRWPLYCKRCGGDKLKSALDIKYERIRMVCLSCGYRTDLRLRIKWRGREWKP